MKEWKIKGIIVGAVFLLFLLMLCFNADGYESDNPIGNILIIIVGFLLAGGIAAFLIWRLCRLIQRLRHKTNDASDQDEVIRQMQKKQAEKSQNNYPTKPH